MILQSLTTLVRKNLKIFFRSKISATAIILIPFLIVLFAGMAFDSQKMSNIQVGIFSETNTSLTNNIILQFEQNGYINKHFDSIEDCVNSVKLTNSEICVAFPKNENSDEITFYVDYSRMNLADTLIHSVKTSVSTEASTISTSMAQNIINTLESVKKDLPNNKKSLEDTVDAAKKTESTTKDIKISDEQINAAIKQLDDGKETVNNSNTKAKIIEAIDTLNKIKEENKKTTDTIDAIKENQEQLTKNAEDSLNSLDSLISSLNNQEIISAQKIGTPITTKIESINLENKKRNYLIPILLSLIALFGSILLSSTLVMKEKKTRAYFRNFMTPTKDFTFILSTYITCLAILLIQFIIIFAGLEFILKINLFTMPLELISTLFLSFSAFIFIGMFIGYLFRSEETIIFASMIFATILMFFSDTIIPLENISKNLLEIASFNPLVVSSLAFKKILLFNMSFPQIKNELIILGFFILTFMILTYFFRRLTRRKL